MNDPYAGKGPPPCRIYAILARSAPTGVVFRRGPAAWVQVLKWDTKHDTFEAGQWFRGRIYERRCDLSPDGSLLIYFASKFNAKTVADKEYTYAWTAISRPPYLTALALWPKGDCWHGGGLFESSTHVRLNHRPEAAVPHPDHQPKEIRVTPNPNATGEDYPILSLRMTRDGWTFVQDGSYPYEIRRGWRAEEKMIWERLGPDGLTKLQLVLDEINFEKAPGGWVESFWLKRPDWPDIKIEGAQWADWDQSGRFVFAREGKIFAASIEGDSLQEKMLIDLNPNKPYALEAPDWAKRW